MLCYCKKCGRIIKTYFERIIIMSDMLVKLYELEPVDYEAMEKAVSELSRQGLEIKLIKE